MQIQSTIKLTGKAVDFTGFDFWAGTFAGVLQSVLNKQGLVNVLCLFASSKAALNTCSEHWKSVYMYAYFS